MRSLRLLVLATAAAVMLLPDIARPCSRRCRRPSVLMPAADATDIPLNARIWIGEEELSGRSAVAWGLTHPRLVDTTTDVEVPLKESVLQSDSGSVLVYTPESKLLPNHTYRLDGDDQTVLSFTTGTTEDTTPPEPPRVLSEEFISDAADFELFESSCGSTSTYGARYSLAFTGLVAVIDVRHRADIPTEFGDISVPGLVTPGTNAGEATIFVGTPAWCGGVQVSPGSQTELRFGTYDIAGNFSGFTDPLPVKIPSGCGCASGSEASSVLLLGMALLHWKRKRAAPTH